MTTMSQHLTNLLDLFELISSNQKGTLCAPCQWYLVQPKMIAINNK
jgi:hypothetical protein